MYILFTHSIKEWNKEEDFLIQSTLVSKGLEYLYDPLLQIKYFPIPGSLVQKKWTGIFVTSQHALWALRDNVTFLQGIPLWCVGEKTASLAKKLGFQRIQEAQGSVENLQEIFLNKANTSLWPFLYIRGQEVSKDLKANLELYGYQVEEYIAYEAMPCSNFSVSVQKAFQENTIRGVCLFSIRGAETFFTLMEKCGFSRTKKDIILFCLSPEIASYSQLRGYDVQYNKIAPTLENLLKTCITYLTEKTQNSNHDRTGIS